MVANRYGKKGEGLSDWSFKKTLKFGGWSLIAWGWMLREGPGFMAKTDGKMDADLYRKILEEDLFESLDYYLKEVGDIIFQQDNGSKHTSRKAKKFFENNKIEVLPWPEQSAYLNPIEHL